jgi:hypothetical protein
MTLARANSTSEARTRWLLRKKDPDYQPPRVELKREKPIGSMRLVHGQWVEVLEGDPDAAVNEN